MTSRWGYFRGLLIDVSFFGWGRAAWPASFPVAWFHDRGRDPDVRLRNGKCSGHATGPRRPPPFPRRPRFRPRRRRTQASRIFPRLRSTRRARISVLPGPNRQPNARGSGAHESVAPQPPRTPVRPASALSGGRSRRRPSAAPGDSRVRADAPGTREPSPRSPAAWASSFAKCRRRSRSSISRR